MLSKNIENVIVTGLWKRPHLCDKVIERNDKVRTYLKMKHEVKDLNGIYKDIAESVGIENAEIFFREYRGQQITFPVEFYSKEYIYGCIRADYDGKNVKQLARKYNYSERSIRRIIKI